MEEHGQSESTENVIASSFELESAFSHFAEACERAYQERWFLAANLALKSTNGLSTICAPPQAIMAIHSDGYKKWVDNPEYPTGKALADARSEEISNIGSERFRSMESVLLDYLRFILKCKAFLTLNANLFESMFHIRSVLELRCKNYWIEHFDLEFGEWADDFFEKLDLSSVIAVDTNHGGAHLPDYTSFQQAGSAARYISTTEGVQVVVERNNRGWAVFRQPAMLAATTASMCDDGDSDDFVTDESFCELDTDDYDRFTEDVRQEIIDEVNDFANGLALSDSDGWFYPD